MWKFQNGSLRLWKWTPGRDGEIPEELISALERESNGPSTENFRIAWKILPDVFGILKILAGSPLSNLCG